MSLKLEEIVTLKNLELMPFLLTFGIADRYKICIGIWKLIHKEQKIGLFIEILADHEALTLTEQNKRRDQSVFKT